MGRSRLCGLGGALSGSARTSYIAISCATREPQKQTANRRASHFSQRKFGCSVSASKNLLHASMSVTASRRQGESADGAPCQLVRAKSGRYGDVYVAHRGHISIPK